MQKQKRIIILQIILLNRIKGQIIFVFEIQFLWFFHANDFTKKNYSKFEFWIYLKMGKELDKELVQLRSRNRIFCEIRN